MPYLIIYLDVWLAVSTRGMSTVSQQIHLNFAVLQHRDSWCHSSSVADVLQESGYYDRGKGLVSADAANQLVHTCNSSSLYITKGHTFSPKESFHSDMETENFTSDFFHISMDLLPSIEEVTWLLHKCRKKKSLIYAKHAHTQICCHGLDSVGAVENYIMPMFVDCGCMSNACRIFHRSTHTNEYSWTALILGFILCGHMLLAFDVHARMEECGIPPSTHTVLALLKACIKLSDVQKGQEMHIEIIQWGFEQDTAVSSSIIDMYAKCGCLLEASYVLAALPARDVVSWTALIGGYAFHGYGQEAFDEFAKMQFEGIAPNAVTFACLLKAWDNNSATNNVGEFLLKLKGTGFERDPLVGNTLVGMYAKLGFLSEARDVFDKLQNQDVVSWNAFISGLVEHGAAAEAMTYFAEMPKSNVFPNATTFTCICKACGSLGAIEEGQHIHMEIIKCGLGEDYFVGNSLSYMYAKCDLLLEAVEVFNKLQVKDVVSWTALIAGYAKHGSGLEGLKCFEQMKLEGIHPNAFTFTSVLRACTVMEALESGRAIHKEIQWKGFADNVHVGNALIGMYAKCGSLLEAQYVLNQLPKRDILSWNTLISGYAEHGPVQEALKCFEEMQADGFQVDAISLSFALKACGTLGAIERGQKIHARLAEGVFAVDPWVGNSLINMYAKCGSLSESQEIFDKLPVRDVVVWSSMIQAFGMNHEGRKAIQCFEDMQKQGVQANGVTFTCLLSACSHASLAVEGDRYFKAMRQDFGIAPTIEHYNCMIDLLARSGHLFEAEKLCELVGLFSEGALSALLTASRTCGETELGLRFFQQNVEMNPEDAGLYVLMTDIFASAGRLDDAFRLEDLRKHVGAIKKPATALIEVGNNVHEFVVGDNQSKDISDTLSSLSADMKAEGNVAHLESVLGGSSDVEKEAFLCEHAEKYALAFGLIHTPQGQTLRVTKNLRMCRDCHTTSKFISKVKKREIVIRDNCCVHYFKDGLCSCGDMF